MTSVVIEREIGVGMPMPRVVSEYFHDQCEQVGMSFAVPVVDKRKTLQNVLNANYRAGKRLQMRFMAKTEGNQIRVWRVS